MNLDCRSLSLFLFLSLPISLYAQPPGFDRSRGRGGFDPSSFLKRLDTNGNDVIDVEEQKGPAEFMISRLQRYDPKIKPGKPIPLSQITKSFEKARAEREGDRGRDRRDRGDDREREREKRDLADQAVTVELLVPGFGRDPDDPEPEPLLGFGAAADLLTVVVTEADQQEAAKRMRYFDKNKDGVLTKDELSSQFAGNPMDFDRNRDGKLTPQELAVRYAVRREGSDSSGQNKSRKETESKRKSSSDDDVDLFNGRRSYRNRKPDRQPEGLPGYFTDRDANGDGQISMSEYASEWSNEVVAEFFSSDFNRDGMITASEAMRRVEGEVASDLPVRSGSTRPSRPGTAKMEARQGEGSKLPIDSKNLKYATRIIKRNDKNNDGVLTPSEWKEMLMSPAKSDKNRDGKVTIEEYALWLQNGKK